MSLYQGTKLMSGGGGPSPYEIAKKNGYAGSEVEFNKLLAALDQNTNKNMLDNWYFGNPVDQRGGLVVPPGVWYYDTPTFNAAYSTTGEYYVATKYNDTAYKITLPEGAEVFVHAEDVVRGYTGAGYTIDRWRTGDKITVCLLAPCVVLRIHEQASSAFTYGWWQVLECADLVGKAVTLSALTDGSADFGVRMRFVNANNAFVSSEGLRDLSAGVNAISTVVPDGAAKVWVQFGNVANNAANASLNIYAAKLELGTQQTLAHQDENGNWVLNEIPDYNEQLLKCCVSKADNSDTYANNKVTPAAINAVNKAGDTMTGALKMALSNSVEMNIQPSGQAAYIESYAVGNYGARRKLSLVSPSGMQNIKECLRLEHTENGTNTVYPILHTGNIDQYVSSGVQMELVWTNASPTSEFTAQTISLDLSKYTHVCITANNSVMNDVALIGGTVIPIGEAIVLFGVMNNKLTWRVVETTSNSVVIQSTIDTASQTDNRAVIPYQIFGIKGVTTV